MFETSSSSLAAWRAEASAAVRRLGPTAHEESGGGSAEDLLRELDWLLTDAVAGWRDAASTSSWREGEQAWQELRAHGAPPSTAVRLRVSLSSLSQLWASRLSDRVPFQYLVSCAHWGDLRLAVGPGVLIPRPETLSLLELAEAALRARPHLLRLPWADAGTGSGALAVGLAVGPLQASPALPAVYALDACPLALAYAQLNARRCGVGGRVTALPAGDWLGPLDNLGGEGRGVLGGILSNPPYIPSARLAGLQPEVGWHEPRLALDGGEGDGAGQLARLAAQAARALCAGGFLAMETDGEAQAEQAGGAMRAGGFEGVQLAADFAGVRRFVCGYRAA